MSDLIFPVDPNAPKNSIQEYINKGYKLVVIGGRGRSISSVLISGGDFVCKTPSEIDKEYGIKIDPEMFAPKPIPIEPIPELKLDIDKLSLKEDARSHRVHPREQKNRERYMKKRRK